MKKFLLVLAVAGFAVACNNSGEKKETTDSTTTVDSPATPTVDTSHMAPSTDTAAKKDSTAK